MFTYNISYASIVQQMMYFYIFLPDRQTVLIPHIAPRPSALIMASLVTKTLKHNTGDQQNDIIHQLN